jgi:hypothetical protein
VEVRKVTAQLQGGWHRLLEIQTRKMEAQLQGRLRRLQAAEASRSRKVQRLADSLPGRCMGRRGGGGVEFHLPALGGTYSTDCVNLQGGPANSLNPGCKGEACDGGMTPTVNLEGDGL